MLILLGLLCLAGAFGLLAVRRLRLRRRLQAAAALRPCLPVEDLPPFTAVGWPPEGADLGPYVSQGFVAIDAYLAEGFAA